MNKLIGKTINYIYVDDEKSYIVFIANPEEYYIYAALGECCCNCWFEDILNPDNMIGSPILSIVDKTETEFTEEDYTSMGYVITTAKGTTDIEYRADASPYYYGDCQQRDNELASAWDDDIELTEKMLCWDLYEQARAIIEDDLKAKRSIYMIGSGITGNLGKHTHRYDQPHGYFSVIKLKPVKVD